MSVRLVAPVENAIAAEDLTAHQYGFVTYNSEAKIAKAGAGAANLYILQNAPDSGEVAEVSGAAGYGSYILVADASAAVGAKLKSDANGKGTAASATADYVGATLKEAVTAAGDIVEATIERYFLST